MPMKKLVLLILITVAAICQCLAATGDVIRAGREYLDPRADVDRLERLAG